MALINSQTTSYVPSQKSQVGIEAAIQSAANQFQKPIETYTGNTPNAYYQNYVPNLVASQTPYQINAASGIADLQGQLQQNYLNPANAYFQQAATPVQQQNVDNNAISQYMSPYISNVANAAMQNINETNAQQQQQVLGNAISKGAFGGDRAGIAQAQLARQQGLANNATLANLYNTGYGQALGEANIQQQQEYARQLANKNLLNTAGTNTSNLGIAGQNAQIQQLQSQYNAGAAQQAQHQNELSTSYQQWLNAQQAPYNQLNWFSNLMTGTASALGGQTVASIPQPSTLAALTGAATTLVNSPLPTQIFDAVKNRGGSVQGYNAGGRAKFAVGGGTSSDDAYRAYMDAVRSGETNIKKLNLLYNNYLTAKTSGVSNPDLPAANLSVVNPSSLPNNTIANAIAAAPTATQSAQASAGNTNNTAKAIGYAATGVGLLSKILDAYKKSGGSDVKANVTKKLGEETNKDNASKTDLTDPKNLPASMKQAEWPQQYDTGPTLTDKSGNVPLPPVRPTSLAELPTPQKVAAANPSIEEGALPQDNNKTVGDFVNPTPGVSTVAYSNTPNISPDLAGKTPAELVEMGYSPEQAYKIYVGGQDAQDTTTLASTPASATLATLPIVNASYQSLTDNTSAPTIPTTTPVSTVPKTLSADQLEQLYTAGKEASKTSYDKAIEDYNAKVAAALGEKPRETAVDPEAARLLAAREYWHTHSQHNADDARAFQQSYADWAAYQQTKPKEAALAQKYFQDAYDAAPKGGKSNDEQNRAYEAAIQAGINNAQTASNPDLPLWEQAKSDYGANTPKFDYPEFDLGSLSEKYNTGNNYTGATGGTSTYNDIMSDNPISIDNSKLSAQPQLWDVQAYENALTADPSAYYTPSPDISYNGPYNQNAAEEYSVPYKTYEAPDVSPWNIGEDIVSSPFSTGYDDTGVKIGGNISGGSGGVNNIGTGITFGFNQGGSVHDNRRHFAAGGYSGTNIPTEPKFGIAPISMQYGLETPLGQKEEAASAIGSGVYQPNASQQALGIQSLYGNIGLWRGGRTYG